MRLYVSFAPVGYFIGVPFAALISGAANPRLYALSELDWPRGLVAGSQLTLATFLIVSLVMWLHSRHVRSHYPPYILPFAFRRAQLSQPWGAAFVLFDSLCMQAHWAFYRAGAIIFVNDVYLGALGGLALIGLEWLLDPRWRRQMTRVGQAEDQLLVVALALFNTAMFIYTANFWLMLLAHILLWLGWLAFAQHWYKLSTMRQTLTT